MHDTYYSQADSIDAAAVVEALRSNGTPQERPGNVTPPEARRETNMRELEPTSARAYDAMIAALEDHRFRWRTVNGLARQLRFSKSETTVLLDKLIEQGLVIRSSIASPKGEELYTTRKKFAKTATFLERLRAAIRNRAD